MRRPHHGVVFSLSALSSDQIRRAARITGPWQGYSCSASGGHEETWGSARLRGDPPVPVTPPRRPSHLSPQTRPLGGGHSLPGPPPRGQRPLARAPAAHGGIEPLPDAPAARRRGQLPGRQVRRGAKRPSLRDPAELRGRALTSPGRAKRTRGGEKTASRKVRTPKGRAVGNAHPAKAAGKCHRNTRPMARPHVSRVQVKVKRCGKSAPASW